MNIKLHVGVYIYIYLYRCIVIEDAKDRGKLLSFTVIISKTSTKFCPVGDVRRSLEAEKLDQLIDKEAFLIPRLFKTKKGHNVSKTKGAVIVYDREERQGRTQGGIPSTDSETRTGDVRKGT